MDIKQGQSTVLTAVPLGPSGSPTSLPAGDVPAWSVDAPGSVDLTPSSDGLSLNVAVHADAPAGDIVFQITDGLNAAATGTFTLTVPAPVAEPVNSFAITASTPA